jgi:serine/threonine protein kinase
MNKRRWERVKRLFTRARRISPGQREAFLRRECKGDDGTVSEVLRLLESEDHADGFLDPPAEEDLELPLQSAGTTLIGARLDDFELIEEIGRGAMGVVYLGRQVSLDRRVAVKVLAPHLSGSPERQERFRREALAASRLRHPNIVTILSFGEQRGLRYIAMELVEGKSLRDVLAQSQPAQPPRPPLRKEGRVLDAEAPAVRTAMTPAAASKIILGVARALEHCHGLGIIHRDIKPHNILIDGRGESRLVDFGLAKDLDLDSISQEGSLTGTPHYMSPEQARAQGSEVDHRTDIYSAGAVLYELLTLRRPFEGANSPAVLYSITHEKPRSIAEFAPGVPGSLSAICMKAMSRLPERRYQSAREFAQDLERFTIGERVRAPRPHLWRRAYDYVFYQHPKLAGAAAVVLFAALVMLTPRPAVVSAAGMDPEMQRLIETLARHDFAPPSQDEAELKRWRILMKAVRQGLMDQLPKEPIYHED